LKNLDSAAQASTGIENIMEFAAPCLRGGTAFLKPIYTKLTTHISSKIFPARRVNDSMENLTFALSNYI